MNSFKIQGYIVDIENRKIFAGEVYVENGVIDKIIETPGEDYDDFIMPGFIEAHAHVESSMLTPVEFSRAAVCHGTVASVSDPHEIANVLGVKGVEFMLENAKLTPFKFYFGAPSCVPATGFESSGAVVSADDIEDLFRKYNLAYLSEMMNFPGVIYGDEEVMRKIDIAHKYGKPVDGHAPGLKGLDLQKYLAAGITTDHECFDMIEALEKIGSGMKVLIREGSAAKNFEALHLLIKECTKHVMFCSDDKHPDDLLKGHINKLAARAIELGHDLFDVLNCAIVNPIEHYNLKVGRLKPGDAADFILVDNMSDFNVNATYINGREVFVDGEIRIDSVDTPYVNKFNINKIALEDIQIKAKTAKIKAICAIEGELITEPEIVNAKIENGFAVSDTDNDILKIVVVNRYEQSAPAIGFINNLGLKKGALATSVAHDSHNLIAVGANDADILSAINSVIETKGGMVAVCDGDTYKLALPIAGLMSEQPADKVAEKYETLNAKSKEMGCTHNAPFMTLSFMALLVIPKLKLGDRGLFDGEKFEFTELFV